MANRHIVVNFQMFDAVQELMVYEDGACVSIYEISTNQLENVLRKYTKDSNITSIDIIGNKKYLEKIKANVKTDFAAGDVDINIVER